MITNFPILPDSIFNALVILGALATAVYITSTDEAARREDKVREFKIAVEKNRKSQTLADYYTVVADGDFDDRDYWDETAKQFGER